MGVDRMTVCRLNLLAGGLIQEEPDSDVLLSRQAVVNAELRPETIIEELPLAPEVVEALTHRTGRAGEILDTVITYESGDFDSVRVQANRRAIGPAYLESLRWAASIMATARAGAAS